MKFRSVISLLVLALFILCGCSSSGTEQSTASNTAQDTSTEDTAGSSLGMEADTVLAVSSLNISSLLSEYEESYILLEANENGGSVFRIYLEENPTDPNLPYYCIEYYETPPLTGAFLSGEDIQVNLAFKNTINGYDFNIFNTRFCVLERNKNTSDIDVISTQWNAVSDSCIISGATRQCLDLSDITCGETAQDTDSDDNALLQLMYLLYEDRGTGKQHFGPTQS